MAEVAAAGGSIASDAWWVRQSGPTGSCVSDEAADWIEAIANGEDPETPNSSI